MPWVMLVTQPTRAGTENQLKGSCGCCLWCQEGRSLQKTRRPFLPSLRCVAQGEGWPQLCKTLGLLSFCMHGSKKSNLSLNGHAELEPLATEVPPAWGLVSGFQTPPLRHSWTGSESWKELKWGRVSCQHRSRRQARRRRRRVNAKGTQEGWCTALAKELAGQHQRLLPAKLIPGSFESRRATRLTSVQDLALALPPCLKAWLFTVGPAHV